MIFETISWGMEMIAAIIMAGSLLGAPVAAASSPLEAPKLYAPGDGWTVSDIAADFRWQEIRSPNDVSHTHREYGYKLEVATDARFADVVHTYDSPPDYGWWKQAGEHHVPERPFKPGTYYWRVRTYTGTRRAETRDDSKRIVYVETATSAWSEIRRFTVVAWDGKTQPLVRLFTPEHPLLLIQRERKMDFFGQKEFDVIPEDVRPHVGYLLVGHSEDRNVAEAADDYQALTKRGVALFDRGTVAACEIEWVFKHYPSVVGVDCDEMGGWWNQPEFRRHLERMILVCAAHGRYFLEAEGDYRALPGSGLLFQQRWVDMMKKYGRHVILGHKGNISPVVHASKGYLRGLWLDGLIDTYATWFEGFYWDHAGFRKMGEEGAYRGFREDSAPLYMPASMWARDFLLGASEGACIFTTAADRPNWREGDVLDPAMPDWLHFVLPFYRAMLRKRLIVTRPEAIEQTRVAVQLREKLRNERDKPTIYMDYDPLFRATCGLGYPNSAYADLIPDNGRYYYIPLVSPLSQRPAAHIKTVLLDDVDAEEKVKAIFDAAYPKTGDGTAWVCRVGDKFYIVNSRENADEIQDYRLPLTNGVAKTISGRMGIHTYLVGKMEDGGRRLWLQANTQYKRTKIKGFVYECPSRDTAIRFECDAEPAVAATPAVGLKTRTWNPATKTLDVVLSHVDAHGAVELELELAR